MKRFAFFMAFLALSTPLWAASPWSGVWLMRESAAGFRMTMTLEEVGAGWRITMRIPNQDAQGTGTPTVMSLETALDGTDAATLIDGKPSGQSMQIRKIDDRHTVSIITMQGKQIGVSKSELSADGKTITAENDYSASDPSKPGARLIQHWDKQ